eukprot:1630272-Rhodomonas_salina.4
MPCETCLEQRCPLSATSVGIRGISIRHCIQYRPHPYQILHQHTRHQYQIPNQHTRRQYQIPHQHRVLGIASAHTRPVPDKEYVRTGCRISIHFVQALTSVPPDTDY